MKMDFDIPDISEETNKAATGKAMRKPRRVGALRLGDSLKAVSHHFTCTEEKVDEDRKVSFYSLSEGDARTKFYGVDASLIGLCVHRKKVAAIYMEVAARDREALMKNLKKEAGEGAVSPALDVFADTVTSIFVTKPEKNEHVFTVALMDSGEAKVLSDQAAIDQAEKDKQGGFLHHLFKAYFDPVGRTSQRSYIPKIITTGVPAAAILAVAWFQPELLRGDITPFNTACLVVGTACFVSLLSLGMRRLSDAGISHLWYWVFFAILFAINQVGEHFIGDGLTSTLIVGVVFLIAIVVLAFLPGQPKKNKYGPVPKE